MSHRNRKQRNKSILAWLVVAGLLLVGTAIVLAVQGQTGGGTPVLAVEQKQIDFGTVKNYTKKTFSFTVTNTGTGTLRFREKPYVQVLEGCCPPDLDIGSLTLKPGESTTVTSAVFMMHPGMDGKHNYAVHLLTNDPSQPDLIVNVLSNWVQ